MTTATIVLTELAEKGADIDMLRQMVQFMAERLMELDVAGRCGASYDKKNPGRVNSRNGYRDRTWAEADRTRRELALTGNSGNALKPDARAAFDHFLIKPTKVEALIELLAEPRLRR